MRRTVYATVGCPSVRPSVRLSVCPIRQPHATAVCPAARRFRSIAARPAVSTSALQYGAKQQMRGVPRRKLNRLISYRFREIATIVNWPTLVAFGALVCMKNWNPYRVICKHNVDCNRSSAKRKDFEDQTANCYMAPSYPWSLKFLPKSHLKIGSSMWSKPKCGLL